MQDRVEPRPTHLEQKRQTKALLNPGKRGKKEKVMEPRRGTPFRVENLYTQKVSLMV